MIILSATTDVLQVVLDAAATTADMQCVACWRDITTSAYTPGRTRINTNGSTDVALVAAPAASTQRVIDFLSIYNSDTAAKTLTVKLDDNGTEAILWRGSIAVNERLEYTDAKGFQLFDVNGSPKVTTIQAGASYVANSLNAVALASDVTNGTNVIADVTGLSFPVVSGQMFWFRFVIFYTAAVATTGSRWAITGPGAPTLLAYTSRIPVSASANSTDVTSENHVAAYDTPAAGNANSAFTTGNVAIVEGFILPSANGTVQLRFASEVASNIVAKAGSFCQWVRTF